MRSVRTWRRQALAGLAILFAAASTLYSGIWMYYIRWQPKVELGIDFNYTALSGSMRVTKVEAASAAAQTGLEQDDQITEVNGRQLENLDPFYEALMRGRPGDMVKMKVERAGREAPLTFHAVLRPRSARSAGRTSTEWLLLEIISSYPLWFLVVGFVVLFLRSEDRNAWLLALLFSGFIAEAPLLQMEGAIPPALRRFALAYMMTFAGLMPAIFYYFFAVFPVSSPIDRRLPWLKSVLLLAAAGAAVPLGLWVLEAGSSLPLLTFAGRFEEKVDLRLLLGCYGYGLPVLGLASLVWNSARAPTAEARRKIRVLAWGTGAALMPTLLLGFGLAVARLVQSNTLAAFTPTMLMGRSTSAFNMTSIYDLPFWVWAPTVLATFSLPLSFAYAVVKHRVLEVPVLLKRSARYLVVQRGFVLLTFMLSVAATLVFVGFFSSLFQPRAEVAVPAGLAVGVGFGILLASAGTRIEHRFTERLDRAFFRSAYDARQILLELAEKIRSATNRQELARLIGHHLKQALHPNALAVYLEESDGRLREETGNVPAGLESIPTTLPGLAEVARRGEPWDVPQSASDDPRFSTLASLRPECLVPLLARDGRLIGLLVLGPRLSEEPYSGEDKRLLASIAGQAGLAVESIRLAEQMAERMEADRRAALEMEFARQVQARLFPQKMPQLETLEYAGGCFQARVVGGDYYDFLDLGASRLGLVLADVAGKGISAALLMAGLQANLRSHYAAGLDDLPRCLEAVNRLFFESSPSNHYATLFFALYEDASRRLRYANCGHPPPLVLRPDGSVERLESTATVLGLFEKWQPSVRDVQLAPGDTLFVFSDGVTEARSDEGEEFGEARLLEALRAVLHMPVQEMLRAVVETVRKFSGSEQDDDVTVVIARAR